MHKSTTFSTLSLFGILKGSTINSLNSEQTFGPIAKKKSKSDILCPFCLVSIKPVKNTDKLNHQSACVYVRPRTTSTSELVRTGRLSHYIPRWLLFFLSLSPPFFSKYKGSVSENRVPAASSPGPVETCMGCN